MSKKKKATGLAPVLWLSIAGGAAAVAASVVLTIFLGLLLCMGLHPEAVMAAEWSAPIVALLWAGALMRRSGKAVSVGLGVVVALGWMGAWLFLMGRFTPHRWLTDALPNLTWQHLVAWASAPILSTLGGEIGVWLEARGKLGRTLLYGVPPVFVIVVGLLTSMGVRDTGNYVLQPGISLSMNGTDKDGNTARLFTFDFAANPKLRPGIYDCDAHDAHPFDDNNTSFLGTPAISVFEKIGRGAAFVVNAGFYCWNGDVLTGSHVAPMVENGKAHYNVYKGATPWTFGWKMFDGVPRFRLAFKLPYDQLTHVFDNALGHVRPLVINGKPIEMGMGPGLTFLNCSRVSIGWSEGSKKLYILVVRGRDSERASTTRWRIERRKTSGWDLLRVQQFWVEHGIKNAIALDGGDSTQIAYKAPDGIKTVSSGRFAYTFGYVLNKPLRLWLPLFPMRHSHVGVMNYVYVTER